MDKQSVVTAMFALAHPARLDVFRALVVAGQPGLTPGKLIEMLGIPSATMSFHLKELASAGLVTQERASRNVIYRAAYEQMNGLIGYLTENCCAGAACAGSAVTMSARSAPSANSLVISCPSAWCRCPYSRRDRSARSSRANRRGT